jgi:archaeosine-15-forming tRNA-guanine transglycosylase
MGGIDEVIAEMKRDELEGATKLPPIQYAHLRGMYPQKVYAALRHGKLKQVVCECGRKVVVVEEADEYFKLGRYSATGLSEEEEEVPGSDLDPGDEE